MKQLKVGDRVKTSRPDSIGVIIEIDDSIVPYCVKFDTTVYWYNSDWKARWFLDNSVTLLSKTHETVLFEAIKDDVSVILELDINHFNKTYNVCVKNQEMVPFKNDSIEVFKLKIRALKNIVNYVETVLKND